MFDRVEQEIYDRTKDLNKLIHRLAPIDRTFITISEYRCAVYPIFDSIGEDIGTAKKTVENIVEGSPLILSKADYFMNNSGERPTARPYYYFVYDPNHDEDNLYNNPFYVHLSETRTRNMFGFSDVYRDIFSRTSNSPISMFNFDVNMKEEVDDLNEILRRDLDGYGLYE